MTLKYVATFHTHASAMLSSRALSGIAEELRMAPVPRALSSSCGTCLFYSASEPLIELFDMDVERIYVIGQDGKYELLFDNS